LNLDLYPVRIVDSQGQHQPPGEHGEVIVSNLVNRATVLLNYRLGDLATLRPSPCPCGRTLPMLSFPAGRSDDWPILPSGQLIHPQVLRTIFTNEELIWEYQVIQSSPTHLAVSILAPKDCDHPQTRERIAGKFAHVFSTDVTVDIAFVDSIDRTETGKFRPVLSRLNHTRQIR
jgi:phenylacetate-CoA ligase